jgi:preprotein translocase subunit SecF
MIQNINEKYNKYYKLSLLLPIALILLSFVIIYHTYSTTGDFMHKDISLTGGTTITLFSDTSASDLKKALSGKIADLEVRGLSDNSGKQTQLVILTSDSSEKATPIIEEYLGFKLTNVNSSVEFTGSNLSNDFYKQLIIACLLAFFWMAAVVFIIFAKGWKIKFLAVVLNLLFGLFLGKILLSMDIIAGTITTLVFIAVLVFLYIKYSMPSFAVMFCAFADIVMTLAVVDVVGMKISGAGIIAFLMLIGYSVDTDILLTTRVLRRKEGSVNSEIFSSFKTGMTMTLTAMAAIAVALFFVHSYETALNQIFTILLIGLSFDILNTWVTNTALLKWFVERKTGEQKI